MKTARFVTAAFVTATLTSLATSAHAADAKGLGEKHQLIVSADRLVPAFAYESRSVDEELPNGTRSTSTSGASSSLLFGSSLARLTPHTVPRVGIDFTIIPRLTLGGFVALGLGFGGSRTVETVTNNVRTETTFDTGTGTVFGFGPRVGYLLPLTEVLAFWPRGGFSFYSLTTKFDDDLNNLRRRVSTTDTTFSLDVEPQLAIVPLEHFFFTVGPVINIPLAGSTSTEVVSGNTTVTTSDDLSNFHFGLTAGLGGWFNL